MLATLPAVISSVTVLGLSTGAAYAIYNLWSSRSHVSCSSAEPSNGRSDEVRLAHQVNLLVANLLKSLDTKCSPVPDDVHLRFTQSRGLTSLEANELQKMWGRNEVQEKAVSVRSIWFRLVCTTLGL